jgi:putative membrane protein
MRKGIVLMVLSLFAVVCFALPALAAEKGLSSMEKAFIKDAASSGDMEVELGKVAQQNASSQAVKDFGKKMETDHSQAGEELKAIAQKNNVQLPSEMERKHKLTVEKLSKLNGDEFDKKYMQDMVKDHKMDVAKFKKASKKVKDPELKQFVDKTLPTLEQHLELAKETATKVGAKVK